MITFLLDELIAVLNQTKALIPEIENANHKIVNALATQKKIFAAGNGGSAADALHFIEELVGRFEKNRKPLAAICLCADAPLLTCIANDYGYDNIFSRQINALGSSGDVIVVFSTSGNSENINRVLDEAKLLGMISIALLGKEGGEAKNKADISIIIPSKSTARIQEAHTFIFHGWLKVIESKLFP